MTVSQTERASRAQTLRAGLKAKALEAGNRLGVKVIPHLPIPVKRLLSGGRQVTIDGNTLDPSLQMLLTAQKAVGIESLVVADDPAATRASNQALTKTLDEPDVRVAEVRDINILGPAGALRARHYRPPAGADPAPLLVFFHGGGFVFGDLDTHDAACRLICRDARVHVLAVDYRLAPEHKAPAAVDDGYAAYLWAREHAESLGADPNRVAVGGDSAGGCLAAVVAVKARDNGDPPPALQWLIYPVTDMGGGSRSRSLLGDGFLLTKHDMDWFRDEYVDGSGLDVRHPLVSPLYTEDLAGLPPALIVTCGFDPLRDEGEAYAKRLREAGVRVDHRQMSSMIHAFLNLNVLGGGIAAANAEMISALRAHLAHA